MQFFKRKTVFAVRSPERDRTTDKNRVLRLSEVMALFIEEIVSERDGLSKRYMEIEKDAGFLIDAIESDPENSIKNQRLAEFEATLVNYKRRIRTLGMQAMELQYVQKKLPQKFEEIDQENQDLV